MSAHIIAPEGELIDAWSVAHARDNGFLLTVGPLQGQLMVDAHNGCLSVSTHRERCAAQRLIERGLLTEHYVLTERGRTVWLLVRGEQ